MRLTAIDEVSIKNNHALVINFCFLFLYISDVLIYDVLSFYILLLHKESGIHDMRREIVKHLKAHAVLVLYAVLA